MRTKGHAPPVERANAHGNGWAFGHFRRGVAFELALTGEENQQGNGNEENNESSSGQSNENEQGEIEGLHRDPRGFLYIPHTRQKIELGTAAVLAFTPPQSR